MLVRYRIFVLLLGIFILFVLFSPAIDMNIASAPFEMKHRVFYGEISHMCKFIYQFVGWLTWIISISAIIGLFVKHKTINNTSIRRASAIILISLSLGPGLMVNTLFKNHWGRARPYQVLRDGHEYSPVWQPHFNRPYDNSFPSGHASIGFFLGVPFLIFGCRKIGSIVSLLGGGVVGVTRILQGGHYFSDVIFSGICVWLSTYLAFYIVDQILKKAKSHE